MNKKYKAIQRIVNPNNNNENISFQHFKKNLKVETKHQNISIENQLSTGVKIFIFLRKEQ